MLADLSSFYMLSSIITGVVGTLTLMVTLGIVAWQTTHTAKQTKLNTLISYYGYLKDVNTVLLEHTDLSERIVGDTKEDSMATIALITLELSFKLHRQRLIDSSWWQSDKEMANSVMKHELLRHHWRTNKHMYDHDFAGFIDNLLKEIDNRRCYRPLCERKWRSNKVVASKRLLVKRVPSRILKDKVQHQ